MSAAQIEEAFFYLFEQKFELMIGESESAEYIYIYLSYFSYAFVNSNYNR